MTTQYPNNPIPTPTPWRISGETLLHMQDMGSCELVDGRIVSMNPPGGMHGMIESNLHFALKSYVRQHRCGIVMVGETGIYTQRNPDRVRGADILFISKARMPTPPPQGFLTIAPDLVVEIRSPHDQWQDIQQKLNEYFGIGVHRVWIVDTPHRRVLNYRSPTESIIWQETDILRGEGALDGFSFPVVHIFEDDY